MSFFVPRSAPFCRSAIRYIPPSAIAARAFSVKSLLPTELLQTIDQHNGVINTLSDAFLHLPQHLPFDGSYTSTIIFVTVCLRLSFTVPMQVWQRKRTARLKNIVAPALKAFSKKCAIDLRSEYRRAGKGYEEYVAKYKRRVSSHHLSFCLDTVF